MGYGQIDISEVGPAEYPLIQVLRDTIFSQYKHHFSATFAETVEGKEDVLALIAHLEGNPIGYKVGYKYGPRRYHSWTGGVLPDYRRSGIAKRMQDSQHGWCRSRGYKFVQFNTFNKFRPMLLFGLSTGFLPVGIDYRPEKEIAIKFEKDLALPRTPGLPELSPQESSRIARTSPVHARHDDVALISACLNEGFDLTGMMHDQDRGTLMVRLERSLAAAT
jgi:GNAT superfamily N-acetyltransferase